MLYVAGRATTHSEADYPMTWQEWLEGSIASQAKAIARETAFRLRDPLRVAEVLRRLAEHPTLDSWTRRWSATDVAQGNAGLAICAAQLDACFPGEGWDQEGHTHLRLATDSLSTQPLRSQELFTGLCGVAFAAWLLSRQGTRYQRLLTALDEQIVARTHTTTAQMLRQRHGFASTQYDVLSGLAGVGAYLLCRRTHPPVAEALSAVLHTLIYLSEEEAGVPHWYTPPEHITQERWRGQYPHGLLDCGLAHGVAGPLALLALTKREAIEVEGLEAAIDRLAIWLAEHRVDDAWGVNWPFVYPAGPREAALLPLLPARTAWCYGNPGIAWALWMAGEALNRTAYRELALDAMAAVYRKPMALRQIDAPTFCHGIAGLLAITLRFAQETNLPIFREATQMLTEQLMAQNDPDALLGFYDVKPGPIRFEHPGLLTGTAGVVLTLLAVGTDQAPTWNRVFLLS